MKKISITTSCHNEQDNIRELYDRIVAVMRRFPEYAYEIIVADNRSTDNSKELLKQIALRDKNFKVIFNSNNFGPMRSGYSALLRASGDAVVVMSSDLQDPPELIAEFISKWKEGYQVVAAIKSKTKETYMRFLLRQSYYSLLSKFADEHGVIQNFTGYGLYDRKFMDALRTFKDATPYFRGFISEIGFRRAEVEFVQPARKYGRSKHNFSSLYSYAISGFINHSKLPLRLATFSGFCLGGLSLVVAFSYLIYKLVYWDTFSVGIAPIVIGLFFFSAVQLIFIGIVGEYVGEILTQVKGRPYTIIDEIINFDDVE